jgi:hypothetical protein
MSSIFENLKLNYAIFHELQKRDDSNTPATIRYGNTVEELAGVGKDTLQTRIMEAMGNNTHCVQMDIVKKNEDSVCSDVDRILRCSSSQFVEYSKAFPEKLALAQISKGIPGGIVVVITGTTGIGNSKCCIIIKAEAQTGFHKMDGKEQLRIEFLNGLFLTPTQKLYKIGFFIKSGDSYDAFIYDFNLTKKENTHAAKYFYEGFLGCQISKSNKADTQKFFLLTREFINDMEASVEEKLNYQDELYTYLRNTNDTIIGVKEFAEKCFSGKNRDIYREYMIKSEYPDVGIVKDLELLKNILKRRNIHFSSGVELIRKNGMLRDVVKIISSKENETVLAVSGKMEDQKN